jgi:hypothetical protein
MFRLLLTVAVFGLAAAQGTLYTCTGGVTCSDYSGSFSTTSCLLSTGCGTCATTSSFFPYTTVYTCISAGSSGCSGTYVASACDIIGSAVSFITYVIYGSIGSVVFCVVACVLCQYNRSAKLRRMQREAQAAVVQSNSQNPTFGVQMQQQPVMVQQPGYAQAQPMPQPGYAQPAQTVM